MRNHQALKAGLAALGITYAAVEGHQLVLVSRGRDRTDPGIRQLPRQDPLMMEL